MAELKPKKFGYVVQPPPPCHPPTQPIPPGMTVQDWTAYINSYIDVRARQLYDKLKGLYNQQVENNDDATHEHIILRDHVTGKDKKLFISNDDLFTVDVAPRNVDDELVAEETPPAEEAE